MTGAVVGAGGPRRRALVIDRRAEDRWIGAPVRKASLAMSGVVIASLVIHAGLLLFAATFGERTLPAPPKETVVELVQEPREAAKDPAEQAKASAAPSAPKAEPAGPEPKAAEAKPEIKPEIKPEPPKPEPQPEQAKADEPKPEPPKAEPAKPEQPKAEQPKAAEQAADQAKDMKIAENESALQSLKQELDSLKAEQQALKEEADAAAEMQTVDKAMDPQGALGIGTMPPSFGAMQLPQLSEIEGEATGYEQIVFSQLARTKGVRRHMGMVGTAGILFTIDASGKLVNATVAHPSGSTALDDEAMKIVTASAPFPKPPPGATRTIAANFNFVPQPAP